MKRYHKKVFLPKLNYKQFLKHLPPLWATKHCKQRFVERCEYHLRVPSLKDLEAGEIFEVYLSNNKTQIERICVRLRTKHFNSCFVIAKNGAIITSWACSDQNSYNNIDYSIYETD